MSKTPLDKLLLWLENWPEDTRNEIAIILWPLHPALRSLNNVQPGEEFSQLVKIMQPINRQRSQALGAILTFRALFDYAVAAELGTASKWDKAIHNNASLQDTPPCLSNNADQLGEMLPARKEKWAMLCHSWEKFKSTTLTDHHLRQWELGQ